MYEPRVSSLRTAKLYADSKVERGESQGYQTSEIFKISEVFNFDNLISGKFADAFWFGRFFFRL